MPSLIAYLEHTLRLALVKSPWPYHVCVPRPSVFKIYEKPILDYHGVGHRYLQHDLTEPAFTPRHKGLMIVCLA
jgi:hypothetical protein